jgi:1,4-alpha-glucan branching enzyme
VSNFTPVVRHGFRMGVPEARRYRVLLDTDAARFGGSGVLGTGSMPVDDQGANGRSASIELTLPPLATVWLAPVLDD